LKSNGKIIYKLLSRKILYGFLAFFLLLSLILFGNQFFLVVNQSIKQGLLSSEILPLMFMKYARDLPFLFSLSFILSIIYTLNRMYKTSELVVLNNAGISDIKLFRMILPITFLVTFIVSIYSIFSVPFVKLNIEQFINNAKDRPEYIFFNEKVFQSFNNDSITFYISEIEKGEENDNQLLSNVFLYYRDSQRVIVANKGLKEHLNSGDVILNLYNGKIYDNLNLSSLDSQSITTFNEFSIALFEKDKEDTLNFGDSPEIKSIFKLNPEENKDLAEIFYRISTPISLLIFSALSVYVSKTNPRSKSSYALGYGVILYILYYNLIIYFKTYMEGVLEYNIFLTLIPHLAFLSLIYIIHLYRNNLINFK